MRISHTRAGRAALGAAAAGGRAAPGPPLHRRRDARGGAGDLRRLWDHGVASSVDLLGEATVTEAEADRYARALRRGARACSRRAAARWPSRADARGRRGRPAAPRQRVRQGLGADPAAAPRRARPRPARRRRAAAAAAARAPATPAPTCTSTWSRSTPARRCSSSSSQLLDEDEFRDGPVGRARAPGLPARLARAARRRSSTGRAPAARTPPLTVRLVKGAYWDHELVQARQHGWPVPVFEDKAECDRNFEALTRRLLAARPPSGWRSPRTTCARSPTRSPSTAWPAARTRPRAAGAARARRRAPARARRARASGCATYCPVGDLVAGMAYLVRRLLENTANESFLSAQARGAPLDELLAAP